MEEARTRPSRPPAPSTRGERNFNAELTKIKNLHDESFLYIQQGLSCDEAGQREQAVQLYRKGLCCIDQALAMSDNPQDSSTSQWQEAKTLLNKMEKSKVEIMTRMEDILSSDADTARALADPPPTYESATTPTTDSPDPSLTSSLMSDQLGRRGSLSAVDGEELFVIPDGVQIFFITPQGFVSAPSYPSSLGIYRLEEQSAASNYESPPAFLQVGDWTYPLLPGRSPMLRADWGAYIFPDTESDQTGSAVGVIIPDEISDGERAILEDIFANFTAAHTESEVLAALEQLPSPPEGDVHASAKHREATGTARVEQGMEVDREEDEQQPNRTSAKISKGLITAAEWLAWGLEKGAEKTGVLLKKGSTQLKKQLRPNEQPTTVSDDTQRGIYYARKATHGAVKVSAFIVEGLGKATMALARQVAPHIRKQGEKVLPDSVVKKTSGGHSTVDSVIEVAAGGLVGFGTVYMGLENAAKSLAKSLADETVTVVQHKYGRDAGKATENALYATGNLGLTVNNARNLGIKAVAKRTAKDTGRAVLEDFQIEKNNQKVTKSELDKRNGPPVRPPAAARTEQFLSQEERAKKQKKESSSS